MISRNNEKLPPQIGAPFEKEFIHQLQEELRHFKVAEYKFEPALPQVLFRPDLLIVPRIGKLIVVEIAYIRNPRRLWDFSLARIEQLFELKLALSKFTINILVIIQDVEKDDDVQQGIIQYPSSQYSNSLRSEDAIHLLERFYDNVIIVKTQNGKFNPDIRLLTSELLETEPRENLYYLWEIEQKSRRRNLESIIYRPYVQRILENSENAKTYRPPISHDGRDLLNICTERFANPKLFPTYTMSEKPRVSNIKEFFLNSGFSYYFTFDYVIFPSESYENRQPFRVWSHYDFIRLFKKGGAFFKRLRGSENPFNQISHLQKLATNARLISYTPDAETKTIKLLDFAPNLILILDGCLLGPPYDPQRYLRFLIGSGWAPIYLQDLSEQKLNLR
jgi:hypothetical protein